VARCRSPGHAHTPGPTGSESCFDPAHVDVAAPDLHLVGGHAVSARMIGPAGPDIEGPAMPGASEDMAVEPAVGEGSPPMRADRI
jgi:hypothetical protein